MQTRNDKNVTHFDSNITSHCHSLTGNGRLLPNSCLVFEHCCPYVEAAVLTSYKQENQLCYNFPVKALIDDPKRLHQQAKGRNHNPSAKEHVHHENSEDRKTLDSAGQLLE